MTPRLFSLEAALYNFTIRINRTNLTTLPALVPTLDARPALANDAVLVVDDRLSPMAVLTMLMSSRIESVLMMSSQKKKPNTYPGLVRILNTALLIVMVTDLDGEEGQCDERNDIEGRVSSLIKHDCLQVTAEECENGE